MNDKQQNEQIGELCDLVSERTGVRHDWAHRKCWNPEYPDRVIRIDWDEPHWDGRNKRTEPMTRREAIIRLEAMIDALDLVQTLEDLEVSAGEKSASDYTERLRQLAKMEPSKTQPRVYEIDGRWSVGHYDPETNTWPESDFSIVREAYLYATHAEVWWS